MHTFGIGNGADQNLIKNCAYSGFGHHYFIYNENEIEEKVIMSLTNTHLDYQVLTEFKVFNDQKQPLEINFTPTHLSQGKKCEWLGLLDKGVRAHSYTAKVVDPNTLETRTYEGLF